MEVYKFGGALLKDKAGFEKMAEVIRKTDGPLVIVVSALGKTTNKLEKILSAFRKKNFGEGTGLLNELHDLHVDLLHSLMSEEKVSEPEKRIEIIFNELNSVLNNLPSGLYKSYDTVVSFGERLSSEISAGYLKEQGIAVKTVHSDRVIITDSNFTSANILWKLTERAVTSRIEPVLEQGTAVITEGFTGADPAGEPTTLGREGSDYTAAILAKCLNADSLTIWKDVPGLMNADPKRFDDAVQLTKVSYREAIELAFYGASVVHPKTIQPLQQAAIPLYIRGLFTPERTPTVISGDAQEDDIPKIIVKEHLSLLSISSGDLSFIAEDNLKDIFRIFSRHKVHVHIMQNSAISFSVCIDDNHKNLGMLLENLRKLFPVRYNTGLTLVTLRNAGDDLIKRFTSGKTVYLKQESRKTVRFLIKG